MGSYVKNLQVGISTDLRKNLVSFKEKADLARVNVKVMFAVRVWRLLCIDTLLSSR
jgi:hypothetical protein